MQRDEADAVARIHAEAIPSGFLSSLATGLRASLYRGIASAPESGVWVAVDAQDEVLGFIAGTACLQRCYRHVLTRRGPDLLWHLLPTLARASTWRRVWESVTYPLRERSDPARAEGRDPDGSSAAGELLAVGLDSRAHGSGAAQRLVAAFEAALRDWDYRGPYRVVTMKSDARSNRFYAKVGFKATRDFSHHGVAMTMYYKEPDA